MAEDSAKQSLESKVLADISKTGFPLELRMSNRFVEADYYVQDSVYYVDQDEQKGREIEIIALKNSQSTPRKDPPKWVRLRCIVECKKSSKPWVIFTSPKTTYDEVSPLGQATGLVDNVKWTSEMVSSITAFHPYWQMLRRGRSFHEALRGEEDRRESSVIFKAITTTVKATLSLFDRRFISYSGEVSLFQPIVVLEGILFEAYLDNAERTVLEQPPWIPVSFAYRSAAYPDSRLTVLVVTEAALPTLLEQLGAALQAWHQLLTTQPKLVRQRPE